MIYTIGHSTRPADELVELLRLHGIERLADVRTVPRSRRHPQYESGAVAALLRGHGIEYRHFPALGGFRRPRADSINTAWQHPAFRGYADYMATPAFEAGLAELMAYARDRPTAIMCAEAAWWRCHRRLLADALVVRGTPVCHILSASRPAPHEVSEFAHVERRRVTYPGLL